MNIYEKLSAITNELEPVAKNFTVGTGNSSYKAVKEGDVLSAVKPLEAKYKIFSYPVDRKIVFQDTINFENSSGTSTKVFMRIETTYRFVNMEKPEEYVDTKTYGDGVDSQDKASGKAMTYSDKYALLKAYKVETGDDPDKDASETIVTKPAQTQSYNKPIDKIKATVIKYDRKYEGRSIGDLNYDEVCDILSYTTSNFLKPDLIAYKNHLNNQVVAPF